MSDYFPSGLIPEILHKLPLKSVVRCMCVCKAWKSIIANHAFIMSHHQHLQTNANSSLFFHLRLLDHIVYSLYSDNDEALRVFQLPMPPTYPSHDIFGLLALVGTCNGLVCFADYSTSAYIWIWNPNIYKYLIVPTPSLKTQRDGDGVCYGFGFDSRDLDFKVVRFVYRETSSQVEIYSLAAHSWRTITVAPLPFGISQTENKFVNGVLHWLAYQMINGMKHNLILTFDVVEEKFGELMLPQCLQSVSAGLFILTGGNSLVLKHELFDVYKCCTIWVMKEYGVVESWSKLFHFDSTTYGGNSRVLALRNNEEVVIDSFGDEIHFLDPIKGTVKKMSCDFYPIVGDHVESLFLINEEKAKTYLPL